MKRVVLGFSGGVDSAVSSVLLKKEGYEVIGVYLDNASAAEREYAEKAADLMKLPLKVTDIKDELEKKVCVPFCESYLKGETPNPCILCNPSVKFKTLIGEADKEGAELVATGHYARSENGALYKGRPENDQSYMLCRLKKEQIERLVLPLGSYRKTDVRAMARELSLPAAEKPDSMEICFIPDKDYLGWLGKRRSLPGEGDLIFHGDVVGKHKGICAYTVGQRMPGLLNERKVYISKIDAVRNTVELALWEELFKYEVRARDFNWLISRPDAPLKAQVRVRHTKWENPDCEARAEGDMVIINCREPVRAPAAGQSAVLYDGERLLGGGFICP